MSQFDLFTADTPVDSDRARVGAATPDPGLQALAERMPAALRLGTSSWSFPGWRGLVYDRDYPASRLSRDGLAAYARHPLLRTVGIDSSFYRPPQAAQLRHWAGQVPAGFRFLSKGARDLTSPWQWRADGRPAGNNPHFLSSDFAMDQVIGPTLEGLGDSLGILLWQFPPLGNGYTDQPRRFAEELYRFLHRLPVGPTYAVELRDANLITADFAQALHHGGAVPAYAIHPRLPALAEQRAVLGAVQEGPLVVRWMLQPGRQYQQAKAAFSPFDQLQAADPERRSAIAELVRAALAAQKDVYVIANNKAEGSSPLSLGALATDLDPAA